MDNKHRLFIYGRREMAVLLFLGVMIAVFAFTLGVHLGKSIGGQERPVAGEPAMPAAVGDDKLPSRMEVAEQAKGVGQAAEESLSQAVHEEVVRTGVTLDQPVQTRLPDKTRQEASAHSAAKPVGKTVEAVKAPADAPVVSVPAANRAAPEGRYTLQIGSHRTIQEAIQQINALEAGGYQPHLRSADLKAKGKWYRVYLGGFGSKEEAERLGAKYKSESIIDSFVISHRVE